MKLYGTTTSPFVRRIKVIASELGEPVEMIDTMPEEGQALLRAVSPIRKVPVADLGDRILFDSRAIADWLFAKRGYGPFAPPRDVLQEANLLNAIDAATDSVIQLFYLRRDGVAAGGSVYEKRQLERTDAIFAWLGEQLAPRAGAFGFPELAVCCTLDWMDFRQSYPTERAGKADVRARFRDRPSLVATYPKL
ncbi:MAG TPA: glutathione S-transferase family protein [Kofleriaceae bacterium]|jgi:glutathione S-transferase